jgi:flavodoxin
MIFSWEESDMSTHFENKKILVAFFSRTGNTRQVADHIHNIVGGDVFEIQSAEPYPDAYNAVVARAKSELDSGYKAVLKTKVQNIESYDVVFVGYPAWWGTFPAPVRTFLLSCDLSGKTVVPFCTHEGSDLGNSVGLIAELCPKSKVLDALAIRGSTVTTARDRVSHWLREIIA